METMDFMESCGLLGKRLLNLGPDNPLSELLVNSGCDVVNTPKDLDLDLKYDVVEDDSFDAVVGFEILEHLVSPFPLIRNISASKLVLSVPLSQWFAKAYWSDSDPFDRHYHEFEDRQLKMLLNKAGWNVLKEKKNKS